MIIKRNHLLLILVMLTGIVGCAHQTYVPQPLTPEQSANKILQKSPSSAAFKNYLLTQNYPESDIPFKAWTIRELTLSALFYHPDLEVVKQKLVSAETNTQVAKSKPSIGVNAHLSHSNQANGDLNPWAYSLQLDIPIDTSHKKEMRTEIAQNLSKAARMDVAETAWNLRHQLTLDLISYYENLANITQLQSKYTTYQQLSALYQKRLEKGLASSVESAQVKLNAQKSQSDLLSEQAKTSQLLSKLATDAGLTLTPFSSIPIAPLEIESTLLLQDRMLADTQTQSNLQQSALLNRIDIRRSLAQYAVAESKIKLELAKQIPDISLSPGIAFEFGDSIWSLGFASLLNLINQSPAQIKATEQLRTVEGAQFEALQAQIIGDLSEAYNRYKAIKNKLSQAQKEHASQLIYSQKIQKQFNAGLLDRVDITQAHLHLVTSAQLVCTLQYELLRSQALIENIMQRPLYDSSSKIDTSKMDINVIEH
ncbi:MAG: TolC family protein [Methylophilus sp.]|nr:TolC family protein [Methylophilus sp.]